MRIISFEFSHIKAFKNLKFDLAKTAVLVGQNDHGKSSILKAIDIVMNQLSDDAINAGVLHPDLAEVLLPITNNQAKARRITINYETNGKEKQLHVTVRKDLTFTLLEKVERNAKTSTGAVSALKALRERNIFVLIPALRDASSLEFRELFAHQLREHGLAKMIPQKAGGTPKEYRILKEIRDKVSTTIKPYIDGKLLPQIKSNFGFTTQHELALRFDVDVSDVGDWILDNLRLGFQLSSNDASTLALSESGTGVQSGALLALHRLQLDAKQSPETQYILAIEEPEAFLHPQRQKELYQNILTTTSGNLRVLVTTHSPYIVAETPFNRLGLVKRDGDYSFLHVPDIASIQDEEIFNYYGNEVNAHLFFAEKLVLVEGESDALVLKTLLKKRLGAEAHRVTVLSAAGNRNFSPYLRMMRAWHNARIPHLIVTDFDSLTKSTDRAVIQGAKDAGYSMELEEAFKQTVDKALEVGNAAAFEGAAIDATKKFAATGLNVFVFSSDLEYSLLTASNKNEFVKVLNSLSKTGVDYSTGYDIDSLKRQIGSKGIPLNPISEPPFKKPFIHKKLADTINLETAHPDLTRLLDMITKLG